MSDLDPRFSFENFVVGPANRLASAAARRAAENPGGSYNPLYIYAAPGLGKTHIMGAIARHAARLHPDRVVVYQTVEGFLGELAETLGGGERDGLRARYRSTSILLLDDVQFLAGQAEAQEMLLRLLDVLTGEGKQVVLASDRPPDDIDRIDARLRSRFEGGLLVDIGPPEYETRVAIVRKRAEARGQTLDPGVAETIGRVAFRNVRELGGALNRVLAIQELEGRPVSQAEAADLLGEERTRPPGPETAQPAAPEAWGAPEVEPEEEPWRRTLKAAIAEAELKGYSAGRLRRMLEKGAPPRDPNRIVEGFRATLRRLADIREELDAVGNPWPEAAHGVLRDPERLEEAEALLASARERARPFPPIQEGPSLHDLGGRISSLVIRAAEQLIGTTRPEYNPLYLWCGEESAARALLEAAGRSYLEQRPGAKVALVSVSDFAEDFIDALSSGVAGAWRERWWSPELLLIHGAQQLSDTERAQDEFFHLFEALQRRRARIMLAADRPPSRIARIDDRLRSRFEGGLVLELEVLPGALAGVGIGEEVPEPAAEPGPDRSRLELPLKATRVGATRPGVDAEGERRPPEEVRAQDREWIMAFRAGAAGRAARGTAVGEGGSDESLRPGEASARPERLGAAAAWFASSERVVWRWPRLEDRLVEEPD